MTKDELVQHVSALGELRDSINAGSEGAQRRRLSRRFTSADRLNLVTTYGRMKKAVDAAIQLMITKIGETK